MGTQCRPQNTLIILTLTYSGDARYDTPNVGKPPYVTGVHVTGLCTRISFLAESHLDSASLFPRTIENRTTLRKGGVSLKNMLNP